MRHLDETQMVDAVEGRADAPAGSHLASCESCAAHVAVIREVVRTIAADGVPEPSALFWDHFPSRVRRAIDAPAPVRGWFTPASLAWGSAAAALVLLMVLLIPMRTGSDDPAPVTAGVTGTTAMPDGDAMVEDDLEADEAWALVRSVAEDLDYDSAGQVGVVPRAGSIDSAAMELSLAERAELARLIEEEMKRTGA